MIGGSVAGVGLPRRRPILRPRKPLTRRELEDVYARIEKRILKGGDPFGVFALKDGRGRAFKLISVKHADYAKQLRRDKAQQHMIATYDARACLADVWADLCAFDQPSPQ